MGFPRHVALPAVDDAVLALVQLRKRGAHVASPKRSWSGRHLQRPERAPPVAGEKRDPGPGRRKRHAGPGGRLHRRGDDADGRPQRGRAAYSAGAQVIAIAVLAALPVFWLAACLQGLEDTPPAAIGIGAPSGGHRRSPRRGLWLCRHLLADGAAVWQAGELSGWRSPGHVQHDSAVAADHGDGLVDLGALGGGQAAKAGSDAAVPSARSGGLAYQRLSVLTAHDQCVSDLGRPASPTSETPTTSSAVSR